MTTLETMMLSVLTELRNRCLFADDHDTIDVTQHPYIPQGLYIRMCEAINAARGQG